MFQVVDVEPSEDVAEAAWIAPRLRPFNSYQAGSVIPGGFDAYARLDHHPRTGVLPSETARRLVNILAGRIPAPEMIWLAIWNGYGQMTGAVATLTARYVGPEPPVAGPPPPVPRDGWLHPPRRPRNVHLIRHPAREYLLYLGRLDQVAGWMDGPNLWWPADRTWCVASEIDLPWTYVGGSHQLIETVLADSELGARPLSLDESTLAGNHPELGQRT